MNSITIRFYAQLNDFLPALRRQATFIHSFNGTPAVKDVIESLGVPHPEVGLILIDGHPADFSMRLRGGERVSVYPSFHSLEIDKTSRVLSQPQPVGKFALDTHLGKLASYLRMLGFDTFYRNQMDDAELAALAKAEHRILLTRDRGLLKRNLIEYGYCLRSVDPIEQLVEVLSRYDLQSSICPFTRCMSCNAMIIPVAQEEVWDTLPPRVKERGHEFHRCSGCGRVYWAGTHHRQMLELINRIQMQPNP